MKTKKRFSRFVALFCVLFTFVALCVIPVAAANTSDTYFSDFKATVVGYNSFSSGRQKTDNSPMYLYITKATYSTVRVRALGSKSSSGTWTNCTYQDGVGCVNYVTCTVGIKYKIHNTIYERGYAYANLGFHSTYSSPNYITGYWSPDCTSNSSYTDAVQ